jgi:hypothetical protein
VVTIAVTPSRLGGVADIVTATSRSYAVQDHCGTPKELKIDDNTATRPLLSLDSRLGLLRRRRRLSFLKQILAVIGPMVVATSFLLALAGVGVIASVR